LTDKKGHVRKWIHSQPCKRGEKNGEGKKIKVEINGFVFIKKKKKKKKSII